MVTLLKRLLMLPLISAGFLATFSHAEDSVLDASVNRTTLYSNETLELEVRGYTELELNFGSLFNFSGLDIPTPDLTPLEDDFVILNRNQHMSLRSVNGDHSSRITWTYLLSPKRSGELSIPALTFKDQTSEPISITVYPGVSPESAADSTATHMELELSDQKVYVQQQFTLTQRLFYQPPLLRGELPAPEVDNAIVERVGEQNEYTEEKDGREWQVVERTYAVVPQTAGALVIPPQEFQGRKHDAKGAVAFLRARTPEKRVVVHRPPAEFSGEIWLPASSLDIREEWSADPNDLEAGESINRTIQVRALGLLPEALPTLETEYPDTLREYPDPLVTDSRFTRARLESTLKKSAALVPLESGTITIPEIRIPWWDVINDKERVAVVPAREITVASAPGLEGDDDGRAIGLPVSSNRPIGGHLPTFWVWLAMILATGWLLTGIAWWRNRRGRPKHARLTPGQRAQRERFHALCQAASKGQAETLTLLPQWAEKHFDNPMLRTVSDVTAFANDPTLTREIEALQRHLFAQPRKRPPWRGTELVGALRRFAGQPRQSMERSRRSLYDHRFNAQVDQP